MVTYNKLRISSNLQIHICSWCKKLQNVLQHFPYDLYRKNQTYTSNLLFLLLVHKNVWILWTFTAFMNVIYCVPSYSLPSYLFM